MPTRVKTLRSSAILGRSKGMDERQPPADVTRLLQAWAAGDEAYIMETGFRERQGISPFFNRVMRFEPRPGYFQDSPDTNRGRAPASRRRSRTRQCRRSRPGDDPR